MALVTGYIDTWRALTPALRVLLINQFGFNLGFFMMLPFLAIYLGEELGHPAWSVGLILGVRTFAQQGLFLLGGILADRCGYRAVTVAGSAIRTVGFALFALVDAVPGLLLAAFLSGLGGALFIPAAQAYVALEAGAGDRRRELFAFQHVFAASGSLLGPVAGVALIGWDFRAASAAAAVVFLFATWAQWVWLPARVGSEVDSATGWMSDLRTILRNRPFVSLTLVMTSYFFLVHQLYLAIPMTIQAATGDDRIIAVCFILASAVAIPLQVPLSRAAAARLDPYHAISVGLALMACAFIPMLAYIEPPAGFAAYLPGVTAALLLTIGSLVAFPFVKRLIADYAGERRMGAYIGVFYVAAGASATLGNSLIGRIMELARDLGAPQLTWWLLCLIGTTGGLAILVLRPRPATAQ